jgi:N-dimethylarginine dimethylaminohydrolase
MPGVKISNGPEYWDLKKVLMYRPTNDSLTCVTKDKCKYLLFREPVDPMLFQEQYDSYLELLEQLGVEVLLLNDLMDEIGWHPSFVPPNMFFMRDVIGVLEDKILISNMRYEARRYEGLIAKEVLETAGWGDCHLFTGSDYFEGGDLLYLNEDTVMVGYGPRTSFSAAYKIGEMAVYMGKNAFLVSLPHYKVHLDGTMMPMDDSLVVAHIPSIRFYPSMIMYKDGDFDIVYIYDYLMENGYDIIGVSDEENETFGANLVVVKEGLVISYSWNNEVIKNLEEVGIEVVPFDGSEFMKAGGGLHCVFNTILREK